MNRHIIKVLVSVNSHRKKAIYAWWLLTGYYSTALPAGIMMQYNNLDTHIVSFIPHPLSASNKRIAIRPHPDVFFVYVSRGQREPTETARERESSGFGQCVGIRNHHCQGQKVLFLFLSCFRRTFDECVWYCFGWDQHQQRIWHRRHTGWSILV